MGKETPTPSQHFSSARNPQIAFFTCPKGEFGEIWIEALKNKNKKVQTYKDLPGPAPQQRFCRQSREEAETRGRSWELWFCSSLTLGGCCQPGWECGSAQWAAPLSDHHGDHLTGPPRSSLLYRSILHLAIPPSSTLPTKVRTVKAMFFPVVMYGRESWITKKVECQRTEAFVSC